MSDPGEDEYATLDEKDYLFYYFTLSRVNLLA